MTETKAIAIVGVGGQGTVLTSDILIEGLVDLGYDVKKTEQHGLSQRGGSVSTVIRLGEHVSTMVCDDGCADVVVAFEAVEALRAQHYLAEGGTMFVNDEEITPVSVNIGNFTMPERVDERLHEEGLRSRMILQVHDEVIVDMVREEQERVTAIVREAMEGAASLRVPLISDAGTGRNWLEAH